MPKYAICFGYYEDPFFEGEEVFNTLEEVENFVRSHEGDFSYYEVYDDKGNVITLNI